MIPKLMTVLMSLCHLTGCDRTSAPPKPSPPPAKPTAPATQKAHDDHGGETIDLGTATIGEFTIRAARDRGELKAGGDAPIDVWLTTADGKPARVAVVRFWIGMPDAKGSIKARADIEDSRQPNHWHTHAEVPSPLMADAKLWVELEARQNEKIAASFDLRS